MIQNMGTATAVSDGSMTNECLGGIYRRTNEIVRRVNDGTITYDFAMRGLQATAEGKTIGEPRASQVWKTVKLGTHKSSDALRKALLAKGYRVSDWASDILSKVVVSSTETEVELVRVRVGDMKPKFQKAGEASREDIYSWAKEAGLDLCPAEVGPQLRMQYVDQPLGEWLVVAMEPIRDSLGGPSVFSVGHDDDVQWLIGRFDDPDDFWFADHAFVFARRK